jgi:hypothetical protein
VANRPIRGQLNVNQARRVRRPYVNYVQRFIKIILWLLILCVSVEICTPFYLCFLAVGYQSPYWTLTECLLQDCVQEELSVTGLGAQQKLQ